MFITHQVAQIIRLIQKSRWPVQNAKPYSLTFLSHSTILFDSIISILKKKEDSIFQRKIHNQYTIFCFHYSMIHKSQ